MKVETKPKVDHTPADLDEESRLILRAAALIERHGLNNKTYNYTEADGSVCVKCAINLAHGDRGDSIMRPLPVRAYMRLWASIDEMPFEWIIGRAQDEVVAKLRAVALGL